MTKFQNARYLTGTQYAGADKLAARIALHDLYTVNHIDLHRWLFDIMLAVVGPAGRILEVGTGRGDLWKKAASGEPALEETAKVKTGENETVGAKSKPAPPPERERFGRIPPQWDITLTDLSAGMLVDNKAHLGAPLAARFRYGEADVQSLPYADRSFDAVIANYMLYHAPDLDKAIRELRRVLRSGGVLLAMTNGEHHMQELNQFAEKAGLANEAATLGIMNVRLAFNLQNGAEALHKSFRDVVRLDYPTELCVTDVQPVLDYIASMLDDPDEVMSGSGGLALARMLEMRLAEQGVIRISKETGLFVAR
jgi:SAM-dependent methyltransferase